MPDHRLIPKMPGPLGYSAALENVGTSAAPLLSGFAFTLIVLVVTNARGLAEPNIALLLLVAAALLLIGAVQFAFKARQYYIPPSEYLALLEMSHSDGIAGEAISQSYATWLPTHQRWLHIARLSYNAGIVLLLAGVAAVLVPPGRFSHVSALRLSAAALVALGALIELSFSIRPALGGLLQRRQRNGPRTPSTPNETVAAESDSESVTGPGATATHATAAARQDVQGAATPTPAAPAAQAGDEPPATQPSAPDHHPPEAGTPPAAAAQAHLPETLSEPQTVGTSSPVPMPQWIFWVELGWLLLLIAVFGVYHVSGPFRHALPHSLGPNSPVEVPWFGALGGCIVSFTGIFDHNRAWEPKFNYWHPVRPLIGAVTGGVGCLLVLVTAELATGRGATHTAPVFYDAVAFIFGYAETAFRQLIKSLTDTVLKPGTPNPSPPTSAPPPTQ